MISFKQLKQTILESLYCEPIHNHTMCFGHNIVETVSGRVFVDGTEVEYDTLNEAVSHITSEMYYQHINNDVTSYSYDMLPESLVVKLIKEQHPDAKISDTLIESYIQVAASKQFCIDPVVLQIREANKVGQLVEGYVDCQLEDGSTITIKPDVQKMINTTLHEQHDVVNFMKQSKENFLSILRQLRNN